MKEMVVAQVESAHMVVALSAGTPYDGKLVDVVIVGQNEDFHQRSLLCYVSSDRAVVRCTSGVEGGFLCACGYQKSVL